MHVQLYNNITSTSEAPVTVRAGIPLKSSGTSSPLPGGMSLSGASTLISTAKELKMSKILFCKEF